MSRKKRHEEHANHERWLVSYADFITLLFAFFVVLYSSSQVDKRKIGQLAMAIQVAFQRMAVFDNSNTKVPLATTEPMPFQDVQAIENVSRTQDMQRFIQPENGELSGSIVPGELKDIQGELEKALAPEIKRNVLKVSARHEGLVISLREIGFFESGSASLRRSSMDALDRLAAVLGPRDEMLRIEGHTDNVPIHTAQFSSNWELSTARATELIKVFILRYKFSPARLAAAGYAEYHPVDSNDTAEGRAHNRRVDIVVLNPVATAGLFKSAPSSQKNSLAKPPSIAPDLGHFVPN
ncbi:MAG TPA: flagellar motor protein MotB [Candidatus Acidoferrales bacterium]|nr:flagellar motor protein MotB [Candidatus Acidoferrales bacterium]